MDIRKWIARDGFDTNFLVELASEADETTTSLMTNSSQSSNSLVDKMEEQNVTPMAGNDPTSIQMDPAPTASTPLPPQSVTTEKNDVMTSILDEIQQLSITVGDLKAENEALASKALLRELEYRELKQLVDTIKTDQEKSVERTDKAFKMIYKTG